MDAYDSGMLKLSFSCSAVTLPTTLHCMNVKMNSDSRISKFVLTLGVNLNTNGTAMFLAMATIFISRLDGVTLTYSTLFTILLMATIASMSMPSVPSGSLVMLLVILTCIDVDARDISLLFAVDWMLYVSRRWFVLCVKFISFVVVIDAEPPAMWLVIALRLPF